MAKYKVDHAALEGVSCKALVGAACRYCNGAEYGPSVQDVLSIIGIVKVEEGEAETDEEERKRKFFDRLWDAIVNGPSDIEDTEDKPDDIQQDDWEEDW